MHSDLEDPEDKLSTTTIDQAGPPSTPPFAATPTKYTLKGLHPLLEEQGNGRRLGAGVEEKEANVGARLHEEVARQGAVEVLAEQVAVEGTEVQGGDGHRMRP